MSQVSLLPPCTCCPTPTPTCVLKRLGHLSSRITHAIDLATCLPRVPLQHPLSPTSRRGVVRPRLWLEDGHFHCVSYGMTPRRTRPAVSPSAKKVPSKPFSKQHQHFLVTAAHIHYFIRAVVLHRRGRLYPPPTTPRREHLAMSEDISGCHNLGPGEP